MNQMMANGIESGLPSVGSFFITSLAPAGLLDRIALAGRG